MKEMDSLVPSLVGWYRTEFIAGKANSFEDPNPFENNGKTTTF